MMTLHFATGATPDYPWADAYWASVKRHCSGGDPEYHENRIRLLRYRFVTGQSPHATELPTDKFVIPTPANRARSLQRGEFLRHMTSATFLDKVIFTDCDMIMQRPFNADDLGMILSVGEHEVLVGVNGHEDDTLLHEAMLMFAHDGYEQRYIDANLNALDQALPGWRGLPVRNVGVIVARIDTYRRLYDLSRALLPLIEGIFDHYACIQFCICYCIGKFLRQRLLPQTIHTHGHFGVPPGAHWDADGDICWGGEKAVFRHALNLTPEKGAKP